jgi:predicted acetyltransferase
MNADGVELVEPAESLREAYLDFVAESGPGDPGVASEWEEFHGDFAAYVKTLQDRAKGLDLPAGWVPESRYWLIRGNRILGTCGLRHRLTDALLDFGGHIHYGVRPTERRKGYATFMLTSMLAKAKQMGIAQARVTCDKRNAASIGVILKCGGTLDSESFSAQAGRITQRYWITL